MSDELTDYTRKMNQTATYWAPGGKNKTGQTEFAAPINIACRWEDKQTLFKDLNGKDSVSKAVIYPDRPLAIEGYIKLGVTTEPDPRGVANEIMAVGKTTNVRARKRLNKVFI